MRAVPLASVYVAEEQRGEMIERAAGVAPCLRVWLRVWCVPLPIRIVTYDITDPESHETLAPPWVWTLGSSPVASRRAGPADALFERWY